MNSYDKFRMIFKPGISTALLLLSCGTASAEPFYQQQVEAATITDKVLQKAHKQIKEHKEIKLKDKIGIAPFHKRVAAKTTTKQALCMNCHLSLPHHKNERSRSFMNMHSRYIACETCHLRPESVKFDYRWLAYNGPEAGTVLAPRKATLKKQSLPQRKAADKKIRKSRKKPRQLPLAPMAGARIAPFINNQPALLFKDSEFAKQIAKKWKDGDAQQQTRLKARLHSPLEEKGPKCKACHGKTKPLLDLKALGATTKRIAKLQRNTVVRFFDRYKKDDERIRISDVLK